MLSLGFLHKRLGYIKARWYFDLRISVNLLYIADIMKFQNRATEKDTELKTQVTPSNHQTFFMILCSYTIWVHPQNMQKRYEKLRLINQAAMKKKKNPASEWDMKMTKIQLNTCICNKHHIKSHLWPQTVMTTVSFLWLYRCWYPGHSTDVRMR